MGNRAVLGLWVFLLCPAGCVVVAGSHGISVRSIPTLITMCGPRPSQQVIETLIRMDGGVPGLVFKCSTPVRRWVTDQTGAKVYGWFVTAAIGPHSKTHSYIVYKRKHGFAIVAHADPHHLAVSPLHTVWHRRDLVAIDRQLALIHTQHNLQHQLDAQQRKIQEQKKWILKQKELETDQQRRREKERQREQMQQELQRQQLEKERLQERKLAERSRTWKIMTKRPTDEERERADYGPPPRQAKQAIHIHLARVLQEAEASEESDVKIYEPSKAWGRVQGTGELTFGWGVRVRVRMKKKGERPASTFHNFMFRGERIVSSSLKGLGYQVMAAPK